MSSPTWPTFGGRDKDFHSWLPTVSCLLCVHSQDNYTFAQPGIQRKVKALEELVSRIDGKFRWSNALYKSKTSTFEHLHPPLPAH